MKFTITFFCLLLLNHKSFTQVPGLKEVKITINGKAHPHLSKVDIKPNTNYTLTAITTPYCNSGELLYSWSGQAHGTNPSATINLPQGKFTVTLNVNGLTPSCIGVANCLIYLQVGAVTTQKPPVPNFYMNQSNSASITVSKNSTVSFTDQSTNNPIRWRYAIMFKGKRIHYTDPPTKRDISYTFTKEGNYNVYFWAKNPVGQSRTINKKVVVQ